MTAVERDWHPTPEGPVTRTAALALRLASPAADLIAARRALPAAPALRLHALLVEIDETVLPRLLVVLEDGREAATLVVSHRRLVGIEGAQPPRPEADPAQHLAAGLRRIAALRGGLRLVVRHRSAIPAGPEPACAVAALARALAADLAPQGDPFDGLLARLAPLALAWFQWDGGGAPARFRGEAGLRPLLEGLARQHLSAGPGGRPAPRIGPTQVEGLIVPLDAERVFLLARREARGLAAILPRAEALAALAAWQAG